MEKRYLLIQANERLARGGLEALGKVNPDFDYTPVEIDPQSVGSALGEIRVATLGRLRIERVDSAALFGDMLLLRRQMSGVTFSTTADYQPC